VVGGTSKEHSYFAKRDNLWFISYTVSMEGSQTFKGLRLYPSP